MRSPQKCSETMHGLDEEPCHSSSRNPQRREKERDKVSGTHRRLRRVLGCVGRSAQRGAAGSRRAPGPPTAGPVRCQVAARWREGARKPQSLSETGVPCSTARRVFFFPPRGQTSPPHPPPTSLSRRFFSVLALKVLTPEHPPPLPPKDSKKKKKKGAKFDPDRE